MKDKILVTWSKQNVNIDILHTEIKNFIEEYANRYNKKYNKLLKNHVYKKITITIKAE